MNLRSLIKEARRGDLKDALAETIRIASQTGDQELETWARLELLGYCEPNSAMTEDVTVPIYRTVPGRWHDRIGRPLRLRDDSLQFINEIRLRSGMSELQELASASGMLAKEIPRMSEVILSHLEVEVEYFVFSPMAVRSVLSAIRTQLEDRLHALDPQPVNVPEGPSHEPGQFLILKPSFYGVGVDLRALWQRALALFSRKS